MELRMLVHYQDGSEKAVTFKSKRKSERAVLCEFAHLCLADPTTKKVVIEGRNDWMQVSHGFQDALQTERRVSVNGKDPGWDCPTGIEAFRSSQCQS